MLGLLLFIVVFIVLTAAVDTMWFREDDLGTIINGIIRSWEDFIRVFSVDARDFICPVNYHRSKPNLISGFLRPLQHVLFSIEYYFFGAWAYGYYLVHVALHSCNAVLVYAIGLWAMPAWLALFAGLMFAFYPDVSWLTWIATAQNTLCTLFLLLTFISWKRFFECASFQTFQMTRKIEGWYLLAGLMFFLSLLARENVVALPIWFFLGALFFLSHTYESWSVCIAKAWRATWIFFAVDGVYWIMRWWAFGFGTLGRTLNNILLRFPFIANVVHKAEQQVHVATSAAQNTSHIGATLQAQASLSDSLMHGLAKIAQLARLWLSSVLMIDLSNSTTFLVTLIFVVLTIFFLMYAYRQHFKMLIFLLTGIVLMSWPAVVAYPCPRYLNTIYPVISLLMVGGCFLMFKKKKKYAQLMLACLLLLIVRGVVSNCRQLYQSGAARAAYKQRFDEFFAQYSFAPQTRFIVLSSPFVSDIQSIFQTYLDDTSVQVAHEPFTTLAEQGIFGCNDSYRTQEVASRLEPIEGGFRFISDEPAHCAWWIHFSDHPLAWSEKDRAYLWTGEQYQEGIWYACSIGKFKINKMLDDKYLIDVSFVVNKQWIDEHTIFVVWDTQLGCYSLLDIGHLIQ